MESLFTAERWIFPSFDEREKQENHAKPLTSSIVWHVPLSAHASRNGHFSSDLANLANRKGLPITVTPVPPFWASSTVCFGPSVWCLETFTNILLHTIFEAFTSCALQRKTRHRLSSILQLASRRKRQSRFSSTAFEFSEAFF